MSERSSQIFTLGLTAVQSVVLLKRPKAHTHNRRTKQQYVLSTKNELLLSVRRFLEYVILIKFGGRRYNDVDVQKYTFG